MDQHDRDGQSPVKGVLGQVADLFLHRAAKPVPPPDPQSLLQPVIDSALYNPPYPEMLPESPGRKQAEWYAVRLTAANPTAVVETKTRPGYWAVYVKAPGLVTDGVWITPGSQTPPSPPALTPGVPSRSPLWLTGTGRVRIIAPERYISFTFVGTGPFDLMVGALTNHENPIIDSGEYSIFSPIGFNQGIQSVALVNSGNNAVLIGGYDTDTVATSAARLGVVANLSFFDGTNAQRVRLPVVFKNIAAVAVTAGTPVAVWTPAAGNKFRVLGFALSLSVAGSVLLKDALVEILRTPLMAAGIGLVAPPMGNGIVSTTTNNALNIDATATGSVSGFVYGVEGVAP